MQLKSTFNPIELFVCFMFMFVCRLRYQKEFTVRRARREIKMLHSFGTVELEIEREVCCAAFVLCEFEKILFFCC